MPRVDRATLIFFDASCLITAASSPTGGAGLIWSFCAQRRLQAAVSASVLVEARRNLVSKFPVQAQERFESTIADVSPLTSHVLRENIVPRQFEGINPKDEHVVAAAVSMGANFLLTLDRPLIREIEASVLPIIALTPEAFMVNHAPSHPEFPFRDATGVTSADQ